jgi:hypothetical protein
MSLCSFRPCAQLQHCACVHQCTPSSFLSTECMQALAPARRTLGTGQADMSPCPVSLCKREGERDLSLERDITVTLPMVVPCAGIATAHACGMMLDDFDSIISRVRGDRLGEPVPGPGTGQAIWPEFYGDFESNACHCFQSLGCVPSTNRIVSLL